MAPLIRPERLQSAIAALALLGIALHLLLRGFPGVSAAGKELPLLVVLSLGGGPLVAGLLRKLVQKEFGSDLLAGLSIITSVLLHEYLAGALVVLMLSGGQALEDYATGRASSVLTALAERMPTMAQRRDGDQLVEVPLDQVAVGDVLVVLPHALCPVDGVVVEGQGSMDESYLTGEPYQIAKVPGTSVLSGAINGESALAIRCEKPAVDSRHARILQVMRDAEQRRPQLRRLGDQLGAWYTPLAVILALVAGLTTGDAQRFLAVLVIATPCPLLIAIPVTILGSISLAARKGIVIRNPAVLETISTCRVALFDKTGTLTYGRPALTEILPAEGFTSLEVLGLAASLERYSKHPLASAIREASATAKLVLSEVSEASEPPGAGLRGRVGERIVEVTGRSKLLQRSPELAALVPPPAPGMECVVLLEGSYAATLRFRDEPRPDSARFIHHLSPRHQFQRTLLVSGDREAEALTVANQVGIDTVFASQSPEQKLALVREQTAQAKTVFVGDGINDAPALAAATVGIAMGSHNEITAEAADAVILDSSLEKLDVLLHIGTRMRTIALQSAIGGMALSIVGMILAALGYLTPVAGALAQEVIDVVAVLNALRAAFPPRSLTDC